MIIKSLFFYPQMYFMLLRSNPPYFSYLLVKMREVFFLAYVLGPPLIDYLKSCIIFAVEPHQNNYAIRTISQKTR